MPTFGEILEVYPKIATIERVKCECPSKRTVEGVIIGVRAVLRILGMSADAPITNLTRHEVDAYFAAASEQGMSPVSAWSYIHCLRGIAARWTRPYYEARGWLVEPFDLPVKRRKAPRYVRPDRKKLLAVKAWYESLSIREDKRLRIVVTLMLEFGMRNGDVERFTLANLREHDGKVCLCYTPHKTSNSSGRVVCWPVHPKLKEELEGFNFPVKQCGKVFRQLNKEMRELGFAGSKGCYELRKMCIDHVYQKYGAESASSISGDDIHTVTRYYADPSRPNIGEVLIVDLL